MNSAAFAQNAETPKQAVETPAAGAAPGMTLDGTINSARRALVVPTQGTSPGVLPFNSPSSPSTRQNPFPLSPTAPARRIPLSLAHSNSSCSGTNRIDTSYELQPYNLGAQVLQSEGLKSAGLESPHPITEEEQRVDTQPPMAHHSAHRLHNTPAHTSAHLQKTGAGERHRQLSSQQSSLLSTSSQTVSAAKYAADDVTAMSAAPSASTSSLSSSVYLQGPERPAPAHVVSGETMCATVSRATTCESDNSGNVRGADYRAVAGKRPVAMSACAASNNNNPQHNKGERVNNNKTDAQNGNCSRPKASSGDSMRNHHIDSRGDNSDSIGRAVQMLTILPHTATSVSSQRSAPVCQVGAGGDTSIVGCHNDAVLIRPSQKQSLKSDNDSRAGAVPSMADADYVDRFGSYYDYLPVDDGSPPKQRNSGSNTNSAARAPPLRSTYKSEPAIHTLAKGSGNGNTFTKDLDLHNSYSQMLENALFYSQAIEQIRESDIDDTSRPYASTAPRARPGKEDIRQRRARNAITSREVFNITTPSTFIPLPGNKYPVPPMPMPTQSLGRSLAMRSEPEFKQYTAETRQPNTKGVLKQHESASTGVNHGFFCGSDPAVPMARLLPRNAGQMPSSVPVSRAATARQMARDPSDNAPLLFRRGSDLDYGGVRRTGIDQPVPSSGDHEEELKQRNVSTPQTFSSSLRAPHTGTRTYSTTDSEAPVTDDEGSNTARNPSAGISTPPRPKSPPSRQRNRLSITSRFSSLAESVRVPTSLEGKEHHHKHLHQVSSQSRKVATRLLMRAGLSRIAIRVVQAGVSSTDKDPGRGDGSGAGEGVFENGEAMASSVFGSEAASGAETDSNALQGLKAARQKQLKYVDEFGFMHFESGDKRVSEQIMHYEAWRARSTTAPLPVLDTRPGNESKWKVLLESFDAATLRRSRKVKRLIQGGVPPPVRARLYYVLSGAPKIEQAGEYARLVGQEALPAYDEIERDVARCYPDHTLFADADSQGQRQLRRILRAYAQYNRDIGYCQGMGRLVGLFLITGLSEEQAFWVLVATIANFIPRFYERDMGGLREHTSVFEVLLHERNPQLASHLAEQGCDVLMYATPWFITVFTLSLPWPAALRVWDWFLYRGTKVLFRVALGIIDLASPYLLEACPTIAELMGFLLHIPPGLVDADTVIAAAMRVKVSERHIERLIQRAAIANKPMALRA
ncbi:hypothetical protein H4R24_001842 [Coemansia sp. RSA 988]|nr:hypothetical protein H4R24_001842 [Coemansia sp. RSA 988]